MAIEVTTRNPQAQPFGFTGFDETRTKGADIARAELIYSELGVNVPQPVGLDQQQVNIRVSLRTGFTYVLLDYAVSITTTGGDLIEDWPNTGDYVYQPTDLPGAKFRFDGEMKADGVTIQNATQSKKDYRALNKPSFVMIPAVGANALLSVTLTNKAEQGPLATLAYFFRFLQYDVDQAHHWAVNTPTFVRP